MSFEIWQIASQELLACLYYLKIENIDNYLLAIKIIKLPELLYDLQINFYIFPSVDEVFNRLTSQRDITWF